YSGPVVAGGSGGYYNANSIYVIGRSQEKNKDKELLGFNFTITVDKGRFVKEKSKIPITVKFEGGISTWSGLLDVALEGGFVVKPKAGRYCLPGQELEESTHLTETETDTKAFWMPIILNPDFQKFVQETYQLPSDSLLSDE